MIGLRARVHFNEAVSLCVMPDLLEKQFGIARRGSIGICFPMQVAATIAAITGHKASQIAWHIVKNIGVRASFAGWTLEEILRTFELPMITRKGPVWFHLAVTEYNSVNQVVEAVTLGYPVITIMGRNAGDVLENEGTSYGDGIAMAGVIRPAVDEHYHAYLAIGCDTDKFLIFRDTRPEYSYYGYLKIGAQVLRDGFKHIKCLSVNVLEVQS